MTIMELVAPEAVVTKDGKVSALRYTRMSLAETDNSGRPRPVLVPDSAFDIPCDTIIPAIGQVLDIPFLPEEALQVSTGSYMTQLENIFIGGDAMRGASTAINAIGDGRKAAEEIMKQAFFDFDLPKPFGRIPNDKTNLMIQRGRRNYGVDVAELPLSDRRNFQLVQHTLEEADVKKEAARCLFCDELCSICATVCPNMANYAYEIIPRQWQLQKVVRCKNTSGRKPEDTIIRKGDRRIKFDQDYAIEQSTQILNLANYCNECGNCETFCPSSGAPYKVKPRLHLSRESFNESDEGYYLSRLPDIDKLIWKQNESLITFSEKPDAFIYETSDVLVTLNKEDFRVREVHFLSDEATEVSLLQAANMIMILYGARELV
jgi:putative selenate reductase